MAEFVEVVNAILAAIMVGIAGVWIYFLAYMNYSFKKSPLLESAKLSKSNPLVSVILPARNEEKYISRCLDSLLAQDYKNFEIIAIDDSSTDSTGQIIQKYAGHDERIVYVKAAPKPEGWAGKNWACIEGYKHCRGELLLFTDADTAHSPAAMSLAVSQLLSDNLQALSAVPKLVCDNFWIKVALPCLSVFLHTRFSALRVNDPNAKTGYFFGSFYIITRKTYAEVGTHESVRSELVEDGALGAKVKESGYSMRMVRGERYISAVWARDLQSLWQGLRRLMIPVYYQDKRGAVLMAAAVFFIMLEPFLLIPYSYAASGWGPISMALWILNCATVLIVILTVAIQCKKGILENPIYALASPLGGLIISAGFISALVDAGKKDSVTWRDRKYTVSSEQHPLS